MVATTTEETMALVGARIRQYRSNQGLTLKEVAQRTGLSVSMLSMLERGLATASVGTLVSVTSALGVHMYDLFDGGPGDARSPIKRLSEQTVVRTSEGTTRRIAHHDPRSGVEMAVNDYAPGGASGPHATHHDGREFGIVISGRLTVELDGEVHELHAGDVVAYSSGRPHRFVNNSKRPVRTVWINIESGS